MSLGLLGAYDSDSCSSSSSSEEEYEARRVVAKVPLSNPFAQKGTVAKTLPRPSFMVEQEDVKTEMKSVENSVFKNPFKVKEDNLI